MSRVIKASALTEKRHLGVLASCEKQPDPRRLHGVTTGITFVALFWPPPAPMTVVDLEDEITIHDDPEGGDT